MFSAGSSTWIPIVTGATWFGSNLECRLFCNYLFWVESFRVKLRGDQFVIWRAAARQTRLLFGFRLSICGHFGWVWQIRSEANPNITDGETRTACLARIARLASFLDPLPPFSAENLQSIGWRLSNAPLEWQMKWKRASLCKLGCFLLFLCIMYF